MRGLAGSAGRAQDTWPLKKGKEKEKEDRERSRRLASAKILALNRTKITEVTTDPGYLYNCGEATMNRRGAQYHALWDDSRGATDVHCRFQRKHQPTASQTGAQYPARSHGKLSGDATKVSLDLFAKQDFVGEIPGSSSQELLL